MVTLRTREVPQCLQRDITLLPSTVFPACPLYSTWLGQPAVTGMRQEISLENLVISIKCDEMTPMM
jgi:hypothetical protein